MPICFAIKLIISCNAPNGHSHPQNKPLPKTIVDIIVKARIIKIKGSIKKKFKSAPVKGILIRDNILKIDNCAPVYQPIHINVNNK